MKMTIPFLTATLIAFSGTAFATAPTDHASPAMNSGTHSDTLRPKTSRKASRKDQAITSEAGLNIPQWGIAIDAFYDPRLTDLVPGYHVVNIVLTNRRDGPVRLDPVGDKWIITDGAGKKHVARNHGQQLKGAWDTLPPTLKQKLTYPTSVKPGNFVTIDVFIPASADLSNFREVTWKSYSLSKEFNIFTNYEDTLNVGGEGPDRQQQIPKSKTVPVYSEDEYAKTREEVLNPTKSEKWDNQEQQKDVRDARAFDPSLDDVIIIR